ncbi:MAG: hypothetical protein ACU843_07755 [Gammaproteobacteria bacterium]
MGGAGLTAGSVLLGRLGGKILKNVGGKVGGLAGGVAAGKALEQATGVQPVFVTNWPANSGGSSDLLGSAAIGAGAASAAGATPKILRGARATVRLLAKARPAEIAALGAGAVSTAAAASLASGAAGFGAGTLLNQGIRGTSIGGTLDQAVGGTLDYFGITGNESKDINPAANNKKTIAAQNAPAPFIIDAKKFANMKFSDFERNLLGEPHYKPLTDPRVEAFVKEREARRAARRSPDSPEQSSAPEVLTSLRRAEQRPLAGLDRQPSQGQRLAAQLEQTSSPLTGITNPLPEHPRGEAGQKRQSESGIFSEGVDRLNRAIDRAAALFEKMRADINVSVKAEPGTEARVDSNKSTGIRVNKDRDNRGRIMAGIGTGFDR